MLKTTAARKVKRYQGTSSGPDATLDAALQNALTAAAKGEKVNHLFWRLANVHGDFGGFIAKNITVEIRIENRRRV